MKFIAGIIALSCSLTVLASSESKVSVKGMFCALCAQSIERSLRKHPEVDLVKISLASGQVVVSYKDGKILTESEIKEAIKEAGYSVKSIEQPNKVK